jgi:bifunctional non-homologous end joining protein LigD
MSPAHPRSAANPDLPQLATPGDAAIKGIDWFVEPCWKGQRLLARLEDGHVHLTGEDGQPADPDLGEAARVLEVAIDADQALIDGSWTAMPFVGEGSPARERARAMAKKARTGAMPDPASLETRRAFVAWDLIELDGQRLHDIPYQERRRLLESVVIVSIRVRVSPAVRPPIRGWLAAWQADGFTHFVAKQPNSRYWPGKTAPDWLQVSVVSDKMPSLLERVFGSRPARMRQAPRQPE